MDINSVLIYEQQNRIKTEKRTRTVLTVCLCACSLMFLLNYITAHLYYFLITKFSFQINNELSYVIDMVIYCIYIAVPFGIASLILSKLNKNKEKFIVKRPCPKAPFLYIFGAIGIGYLINLSINIVFRDFVEFFTIDSSITASTPLEIVLCFFLYAVLPAILEEWAFRGVLLKNLLPYGKGGAIVFSSILFGVAHVDPPRIIFATAFGLMLSVCYEYTGSLKIPMLIHFLNNAISVALSLIPVDSIYYLLSSQIIIGCMGCGIAAIIFYANKGIKKKNVSLRKPETLGYKLEIRRFIPKFLINFGMIPYVIMYSLFFYLYFIADHG